MSGNVYVISRYEDCVSLLKDPRVGRDSRTVAGSKTTISAVHSATQIGRANVAQHDRHGRSRPQALA